jgi:hypothetical protein
MTNREVAVRHFSGKDEVTFVDSPLTPTESKPPLKQQSVRMATRVRSGFDPSKFDDNSKSSISDAVIDSHVGDSAVLDFVYSADEAHVLSCSGAIPFTIAPRRRVLDGAPADKWSEPSCGSEPSSPSPSTAPAL